MFAPLLNVLASQQETPVFPQVALPVQGSEQNLFPLESVAQTLLPPAQSVRPLQPCPAAPSFGTQMEGAVV